MRFTRRRRRLTRAQLIERKYDIEGRIAGLSADVRRTRNRGLDTSLLETQLERLRDEHYRVRLEIDQTDPDLG